MTTTTAKAAPRGCCGSKGGRVLECGPPPGAGGVPGSLHGSQRREKLQGFHQNTCKVLNSKHTGSWDLPYDS